VDLLSDALFRVTIEGAAQNMDAQIWISTYGFAKAQASELERRWAGELQRIIA
jgi:hypothetical protein